MTDNMMLGSYSDDGLDGLDGYVTEERAEELFTAGLQMMREYLARFIEPQDRIIAQSIRANWNPSWGPDPGPPEKIAEDAWSQ